MRSIPPLPLGGLLRMVARPTGVRGMSCNLSWLRPDRKGII